MTIKQQGGIFGRNPTFNDVDVEGALTVDGLPVIGGTGTMASQDADAVAITGGAIDGTVIGGATAAAVTGTTGQFGTSLNVDGTVTADGLTIAGNVSVDGGTIKLDGNYPVGTGNVALGDTALDSVEASGNNNTAIGSNAGTAITSGAQNVAVGDNALATNITGVRNTAVGFWASRLSTGADNVAMGYNCLGSSTGASNTAIGTRALQSNTTASNNTSVGYQSLLNNTTGINNVANGSNALRYNTTGAGNIGIGFLNSFSTYAPVFDPTTENNRIVMGHTGVTNAYVQVAWTVVSDARDKTAFAPVYYGLDFVNALKPTEYQFKAGGRDGDADGIRRYGFLAQDILELEGDNPVIVDVEDPDKLKLKESNIIPVLVKAIQELSAEVQTLKAKLEAK